MINRYKFRPGIKNAKISLELYADYMAAIVQSLRQPLLVLDADLRVKIANKSFYRKFRVRQGETENHLISELGNGQWNIPELLDLLKTALIKKVGFENFEIDHSFPEIGKKIMRLDASQIYHEVEATQTILLVIEDVTKQREAEKKLKQLNATLEKRSIALEESHRENKKLSKVKANFTAEISQELREHYEELAMKDELTGLPNANFFKKELSMAFNMAKRYGRTFTVGFIDIDRFKEINDTFGHLTGDSVLKEAAKRMGRTLRNHDVLTRYGGDEFCTIMREATEEKAQVALKRLKDAVGESLFQDRNGEERFPVSISVGTVTYNEHFSNVDELLALADENMYRNKNENVNPLAKVLIPGASDEARETRLAAGKAGNSSHLNDLL